MLRSVLKFIDAYQAANLIINTKNIIYLCGSASFAREKETVTLQLLSISGEL